MKVGIMEWDPLSQKGRRETLKTVKEISGVVVTDVSGKQEIGLRPSHKKTPEQYWDDHMARQPVDPVIKAAERGRNETMRRFWNRFSFTR